MPAELLEVILNNSIECDQILVDVVNDLNFGGRFKKEYRGSSGEWFDIAGMLGNKWKDVFCEPALAADLGDYWLVLHVSLLVLLKRV
jgi:hypothetical protein